jgi:hypothetical protein
MLIPATFLALALAGPLPGPLQDPTPQEPAAPAAPATSPTLTLGEFVVKVATTLKLAAPAGGFTPESAAWALVGKGVKVRPELGTPLTEQDAVTVLVGLGYKIRTMTPSRVMTQDRVNILIETFLTASP